MAWDYDCWISGEPASAKNQRRIVTIGGKPRLIKSAKALAYCKTFLQQAEPKEPLIESDVALRIDVFYASRRPDLACMDLIQDLLQGVAIKNDQSESFKYVRLCRHVIVQAVHDLGCGGRAEREDVPEFLETERFSTLCSFSDWDEDWVRKIFHSVTLLRDDVRKDMTRQIVQLLKRQADINTGA